MQFIPVQLLAHPHVAQSQRAVLPFAPAKNRRTKYATASSAMTAMIRASKSASSIPAYFISLA